MKPLKRMRLMREMSQGDLARDSGVTRQVISNIERGVSKGYANTYYKLATALDVSVEELMPEELIGGVDRGKVPAPLLELPYEQRRNLLGLVATRHLPLIPGDIRTATEILHAARERGLSRGAFMEWFRTADVDEIRGTLLPEETPTLEEEIQKG